MQNVGVCHFDDSKMATSGWASINGSTPFRIKSRGDLRTDAVWITNILWRDYLRLNLNRLGHVFDDQFFRNSYTFYGRELGFENEPKEQVKFFSEVFTRFSHYLYNKLNINISECGYRIPHLLRDYLASSSLKKQPSGVHSLEINNAITQSTQTMQKMTGNAPQGSTTMNFIFPRGAYSRWLMSLPYPGGDDWEILPEKKFSGVFGHEDNIQIKGTKTILGALLELGKTKAVLLRVTVLSQNREFIDYQSFGSGSNVARRWATLPEIIHISRFSKIKIEGGFMCSLSDIGLKIPLNTDENEFSLTRSIFLDCLWVGIATPLNAKPTINTATAAYMRAYDRIACANAAEAFYKDGSIITGSFGTGRVTAYVRPSDIKDANNIAIRNGLIPPLKNLLR
ncbi:hypothetical protein [Psychromonas sp. SP041]|uniref:hypothetical protein n=1 Tax=Psychromonas sp. SP041 TaxID=1365007 RepID=UPI0010C7957D|nr:hypothetical protein [Psychromonas sp. SP041]